MPTRLETIRARIAADFPADLGPVEVIVNLDFGPSLTYAGRVYGGIDHADVEQRVAMAADYLQDAVIDETGRTWPEADGRPLFARLDHGQAWWMRDNHRFSPIGQLSQRLLHTGGRLATARTSRSVGSTRDSLVEPTVGVSDRFRFLRLRKSG